MIYLHGGSQHSNARCMSKHRMANTQQNVLTVVSIDLQHFTLDHQTVHHASYQARFLLSSERWSILDHGILDLCKHGVLPCVPHRTRGRVFAKNENLDAFTARTLPRCLQTCKFSVLSSINQDDVKHVLIILSLAGAIINMAVT